MIRFVSIHKSTLQGWALSLYCAFRNILSFLMQKVFAGSTLDVAQILGLKGLKTLWEKKKMLITSIFSFSLQCFQSLSLLGH